MSLDVGLIIVLSMLICVLLRQILNQRQMIEQREKIERILQLLQAYPAHEYSMSHMLERSMAIIFSMPQLGLMSKGIVFLMENDQLCFSAQRGLSQLLDEHSQQDLTHFCLGDLTDKPSQLQFISGSNDDGILAQKYSIYGRFIIPLVKFNELKGILVLLMPVQYKVSKPDLRVIKRIGATVSNLIERKQGTEELILANSVLNLSQQAIFITNTKNEIIRCNRACEQITGYSKQELIGQNPNLFRSNHHDPLFYQTLWKEVSEKGFWQGEIWNQRKDNRVFPEWLTISAIKNSDGEVAQYLAIFTDLTAIKKAEQDVKYLSSFDPLTQLPNRTLFNDKVQQSIVQADQEKKPFALLCLDIDHFKKVNELLGHGEGDKLLQVFADRIGVILGDSNQLARIGGDEFAMIIHDLGKHNDTYLTLIIQKILHSVKQAVNLSEHDFIATASLGISLYPNDADNAIDLIKYADIAMYQVKKAGRNDYQFYSEKLNQQALRKIHLESALRSALKQNQFEVYFQEQQGLESQLLIGAEALLRVKQGELSHLSPAEYIPIAEETGLIVDIGDWVFKEVCRLVKYWSDNKRLPVNFKRVAINISPVQFKRYDFVDKIKQSIKETAVPVQYLEIELTEGALHESLTHAVNEKLLAIQELGITIAIDDFGTGYSSLSRLKQFPIDLLKIDQSFISDICNNQNDKTIVKAIIDMSNALNIRTLAEGIETEQQALLLKNLNCDYGQGFLLNKPLNQQQFEKKVLLANLRES